MKPRYILYLASQSKSRQALLRLAHIPYTVIDHRSNEEIIHSTDDFHAYVQAIAQDKMNQIMLPAGKEGEEAFILTADTLVQTCDSGDILGKPKDTADARHMFALLREQRALIVTGVCIQQCEYSMGNWRMKAERTFSSQALATFFVEPEEEDRYFSNVPFFLKIAGGAMIEGFGMNYLKEIEGSFTAVLGLPLFELRQVLREMGFFS